jgi:hypothetical protein
VTDRPTCWLVHGYSVSDAGEGTTDKIRPYVESRGYEVIEVDYGHLDLLGVRLKTEMIAQSIIDEIRPGDVFIGHSHAGVIFSLLLESGAPFSHAVLIHPALRADWCPPKGSNCTITVFANPTDYATWIAYLLRKLSPGNWIFGRHWWGAMGSIGAQCERITNRLGAWGHSGGFRRIKKWGPRWAGCLPEVSQND